MQKQTNFSEVQDDLKVAAGAPEPLPTRISGPGVVWVNLEQPTREQLDKVAQSHHFHALDVDDCLSRIQLPKVDEYPDYLFIILHFPVFDKRTRITTPSQVSVFLGKGFLVTVHAGDLKPLRKLFRDCSENEMWTRECLGRDAGYLFHRVMDTLVDYWFPMPAQVLDKLDKIEDQVFDRMANAAQEVAVLRRDIAAQRRILWTMKTVMADLEHRAQRFTEMDFKVYFGDINDHLGRIWNTLEEAKETIEIYKDTDFILSQDRMQRIMAILTVITATILPFMVISSIYGMNVSLPGSGSESGHAVGWALLILMATIAGFLLCFFRRKRWF